MGLLSRLNPFSGSRYASEGTTSDRPAGWFLKWANGGPSNVGGTNVTEQTSLNYLAIFACVSLISSTIASLPLVTYQRKGRSRVRATNTDIYKILHDELNVNMSAMTGREAGIAHILTWGNSFSQIVTNKSGSKVLGIYPQGPDVVRVCKNNSGDLYYEIMQRNSNKVLATLQADEMLHVPGLGFDGMVGYSPIRVAKTAINTGLRMEKEAERFITRGIRPPGAIKFPAGTKFRDDQDAIKYRNNFKSIHANEDGSEEIMILEDGADWMQLGIDPESAQLLESRKFTRRELCGIYRVPPHMIGDVEASTSWGTGIEEQKNAFVTFCLLTWMKRIEQEYNRKLFGGSKDTYCEHLAEGMMRGSMKTRADSLKIMHERGIITDNEWREIENLNPLPGGDVRHYNLSEGRIDENGNTIPPDSQAIDEEDDNDDTALDLLPTMQEE